MINIKDVDASDPTVNIDNAMTKIHETRQTIRKLLQDNHKKALAPKKRKSVDKINHQPEKRNQNIQNEYDQQP